MTGINESSAELFPEESSDDQESDEDRDTVQMESDKQTSNDMSAPLDGSNLSIGESSQEPLSRSTSYNKK